MKSIKNIGFTALLWVFAISSLAQKTNNLIIGTYTSSGKSEGIYNYRFNSENGESTLASITKEVINPSYLALSTDKKYLYSVNETGNKSTVSAFKYDAKQGHLDFINKVESKGDDPCYIIADNKNIIVANYSSGTIAVFKRNDNGSISKAVQVIKHTGKSIDPKGRQNSAHAHMVKFSPDRKYIIANDLGEDKTYIYSYNPNSSTEVLTEKTAIKTNAGTGPRHLDFSPNGKYAYLVHEFNGLITAFEYNNGDLKKMEDLPTVAEKFNGKIDGADIHVSKDGKFVYATNRGDLNNISTFSVASNGKLTFVESVSTLGKGPRNFAISPNGKFLLVAHQSSNDVVIFNRDKITGKLTDSGKRINVGAPVCLVFN